MAIMREGEDRLTPDQFCYWFQGFAELHGGIPTPEHWESIKRHLELVFRPVTKSPDEDQVRARSLTETEKSIIKAMAEKPPKAIRRPIPQYRDTALYC
jgi:hypothetical protein